MADIIIKKEYRITSAQGLYDVAVGGSWRNINTPVVVYDEDLDKACRKMSKELAIAHCFRSGCRIDRIERLYYKDCVFDVDTDMTTMESQEIFDTKIFRTPYYQEILKQTIAHELEVERKADLDEFFKLKEKLNI